MIWYVFYRSNAFESPDTLKVTASTKEKAYAEVKRMLSTGEWDEFEILDILSREEVCPGCYHPWAYHETGKCTFRPKFIHDGILEDGLQCGCRKKKPNPGNLRKQGGESHAG